MDFAKAHDIPAGLMDYDTAQEWIMNHNEESDEKDRTCNKYAYCCKTERKRKVSL